MPPALHLLDLLTSKHPEAIALTGPGRAPITYKGLLDQVTGAGASLVDAGIGRTDRVAIVLPNGPEMASVFLSVASVAIAAPLNPNYRQDEFRFYLQDLKTRLLIVDRGSTTPALAAAAQLGIEVLEVDCIGNGPAGEVRFTPGDQRRATPPDSPAADDVALILHTSGTTSRPKIVPISHANLVASARNIVATLRLTGDDRCLGVMPLFHIHGLVAVILASLYANSSVYCTPGFNALKFFKWMEEAQPTWYSAVPTMHQAILQRAPRAQSAVAQTNLRFIRSASAALPPQVMAELEATFGAPVIEAYAMTEAAHQMTSNPLPPARRKPGTVGIASGPEVAIMDGDDRLLGPGQTGEIVVKGPNVMAGYENNTMANAEAFSNGWFRTGDQGMLDDDGYLTITGRLKEIINRGGEKIAPREIDDLLITHPAVLQAVAFAVPHDKLGEEVAVAVVCQARAETNERELRDFLATRLASFKVPRRFVFLDEIPKGPTGKIQRIGLAAKLGL